MDKSILIELLKTFTQKEIREFGEFIRSPYFNKSESVINLYNYLRKFHPDFPQDKIIKEDVYSKTFAGSKYNDGFMRRVMFNLTRLAEKYMTYLRLESDPIHPKINLLTELNKRKLEKTFKKHFSEAVEEIEKFPSKDHMYYYGKYMLENLMLQSMDSKRYKKDLHDKKESHNDHVLQKLFWFTNYSLILSMNMYRFLYYQSYTDQLEFKNELLDEIINFLIKDNNSYTENIVVKLHLYEIMLMKSKSLSQNLTDDAYYHLLKEMLTKEQENLSNDSRFSLYNILHQHCFYKILRGFDDYLKERWELDQIALKQNIFKSQMEIYFPPPAFASIVRDAVQLKEFDWAEFFIEKYKGQLETLNYETALNLSYSQIHFYKGEYQKALEYLNKIKPIKRWEFKFGVKELTLMIYYELSMFEQALYLIDSFRHFISKMGVHFSEERIISRNNFINCCTKILKLKEKNSNEGIEDIKKDLENKNHVILNRKWLSEKIKELERLDN